MSAAGRASFDLAEQQQAFVGLLTRPLLTPDVDPELHRRVGRHRPVLTTWAGRLGYRVVSIGSTFRLRRVPMDHAVAAPAGPAPPRRELVLALVVAACLEDITGDAVTIQDLSDAVRDAGALGEHTAYNPERRADRATLVRALGRLTDLGVLARRTGREELVREWENSGQGPGAGYRVNRDALLLMVDPRDVALARPAEGDPAEAPGLSDPDRDPRSATILRRLVETQGLLYTDLSPSELDYFRMQRQRLLARACEMTGATAEVRREGVLLVLAPDGPHSQAATVDFPAVTAAAWVSLHLVDAAAAYARAGGPAPDGGTIRWPADLVDAAAAAVYERVAERLTVELRTGPDAVRASAEAVLRDAGLLETTPEGDWLVSPLAGRYRAASLHTGRQVVTQALDGMAR